MSALVLPLLGGLGVFYLYTAVAYGWTGVGPGPAATRPGAPGSGKASRWLVEAGLDEVGPAQFATATAGLATLGAVAAYAVFGGVLPAAVVGLGCASAPAATYRVRRSRRMQRAHDAWPRMIEEMRIMTASTGRSVPQALFDVGRRAPDELRGAFDAAHREWLLTTDFDATLDVLKARLADPTVDAVCETLLVAHHLGGTDLDRRLAALAEDRRVDAQGRRDAVARQAGARFARWFTIIVPVGMALVGMSIGDGRAAYRTDYGQVLVAAALALTVCCWVAASAIMALPAEERVFPERRGDPR